MLGVRACECVDMEERKRKSRVEWQRHTRRHTGVQEFQVEHGLERIKNKKYHKKYSEIQN